MDLDGVRMYVSSTADRGVVGLHTLIVFSQKGSRVLGRYRGGAVDRGFLVGHFSASALAFRYAQREVSGEIHGGRSTCEVMQLHDGALRALSVEHPRGCRRQCV